MPGQTSAIKREISLSICSRLAALGGALSLPPRLSEPTQHLTKDGEPTLDSVETYLQHLLAHDPASFLERHLRKDELEAFDALSADYEVGFHLRQLSRSAHTSTSSIRQAVTSPIAKNRRLAAMHQLHAAGEYFSIEAMQGRDPLLYEQCIGQYTNDEGPRSELLSETLMRQYQQSQLRTKMEQLQEREDEQLSEHDSDEESEGGRGDVTEGMQSSVVGTSVNQQSVSHSSLRSTSVRGIHAGRPMHVPDTRIRSGVKSSDFHCGAHPTSPIMSASTSGAAAAAAVAAAMAAINKIPTEGTQPISGDPMCRPHANDLSMQELDDKRQQFVKEMEARFLFGQDGSYVNYNEIDANSLLDDHWLTLRGRDAEDAYFDTDSDAEMDEAQHNAGILIATEPQQDLEEWEIMADAYSADCANK